MIWSYFRALQYKKPFPRDVQVDAQIANNILSEADVQVNILPHLLLVLFQELVIWNRSDLFSNNSFSDWGFFSKTYHKIHLLWSAIDGLPEYNSLKDPGRYFFISTNHQFHWQMTFNFVNINRYYEIYNTPKINKIVQRKLGITLKQLYQRAVMIWLGSLNSPFFTDTVPDDKSEERHVLVAAFLYLSRDVDYYKNQFAQLRGDSDIVYSHNPLFDYPALRLSDDYYSVPVPYLILRKVSVGLHYDLKSETGFDSFGKSFERYVGKTIDISYPDKIGDSNNRDGNTVDWIVKDDTALLFIECKSKNLHPESREDLQISNKSMTNFEDMADFIIQGYKAIKRYLDGEYPNLNPTSLPIYLLILTIEDWNFNQVREKVNKYLIEKLGKERISIDFIEKYPYSMVSIDDFEISIKIMKDVGIQDFLGKKTDKVHERWPFPSYFNKYYEHLAIKFEEEREQVARKNLQLL